MEYDHAACPHCGWIWQFDGFAEAGEVAHCIQCANNYRVGRWCGKHYPSFFGSLFRSPVCPNCNGTNSVRGVQVGFYSIRLYMRQCKDCHAVWVARK